MSYTVAKYLRLSVDDTKSESMSIENQRFLLDDYITTMEEPDIKVLEFVDNGYSGTNFERPAIQELLSLVSNGEIDCIIVKDFSRFGRNMVEAGYFLQVAFPLYKTRFIALSDLFDSSEHNDDTFEVAIKLLISEQYSRDLSQKIKSAKRSKALRGEAVTENCLFGYKKVGNKLEVDETAAETVKMVFNMRKDGLGLTEIATKLHELKRPTPLEYKLGMAEPLCVWNLPVLLDMLSNEQYIGTYTVGKSKAREVGSGKYVRLDESEWIKKPDHHPAIISKTMFSAVQEVKNKRPEPLRKRKIGTWQRYRGIASPLNGKVFCGCCDHNMKPSSTRNIAFHCSFTRAIPDAPCYRHKILSSDLSETIFSMIKDKMAALSSETGGDSSQPILPAEEYNRLVEKSRKDKMALYEQFVRGEIDAETFKNLRLELDDEAARLTRAQSAQKKALSEQESRRKLKELAKPALDENELTRGLADLFVDKVTVFPGGQIDVQWNKNVI